MPLAMITGGGSLMARATAKCLIAEGWKIAFSDIEKANAEDAAAEFGGAPTAFAGVLDVTDRQAAIKYADGLVAEHGSIDALVTLAGGQRNLGVPQRPFVESQPEEWFKLINANLIGVINSCYAVLPHMVKAKSGAVVNIASGRGLRGAKNNTLYSLAKAGIIRFTQSVAIEVAPHGVRVNSLAPGSAESRWMPDITVEQGTAMSPLGVRTSAADVGNAIEFLISQRAKHITGSCLDTSGGVSLY